MKGLIERDKSALRFCRHPFADDAVDLGVSALITSVFGARPSLPWAVSGLYDGERCVAGLQVSILALSCATQIVRAAALRNVAVAVDWRGRGAMRALLERTLPFCDDHADVVLLFTETYELYARFGFAPVAQSAFEGPAPEPSGHGGGIPVDPARDVALLARLLATRAPVSTLCAVTEDAGLTAHALAAGEWPMIYHNGLDAVIVSERDGDTLVLVDVVTSRMPSAAKILGALGVRPKRLKTLFPPDCLEWRGTPVRETTGLMMRGSGPPAMREPFMLPPTVDF